MEVKEAIERVHAWIREHETEAPGILEDIYARQTEKDITYQDRPIPTFLRPCFVSAEQRDMIRDSSQVLIECAERFIRAYREDPSVRSAIGLPPDEVEYALMDSGLKRQIVVARPDGFLKGDDLKFLEFNADSPAGVAWTDLHEEVFLGLPHMQDLAGATTLGGSDCRRIMLEAFLRAYKEFGLKDKPVAAIVDWRDVSTLREFYVNKRYFEQNGIEAVVADPRDMELKGDRLYAGGRAVNLIYRRVIIGEVIAKKDEPGIRDFLEAFRKKLCCFVNPFCSKIPGSKSFMGVLSDERFDSLFTARQNQVRRDFVPATRVLKPGEVTWKRKKLDVYDLARKEKERVVIKPTFGYGGRGVNVGREKTEGEWDQLLQDAAGKPGEWTLQEYVEIPEEPFPVFGPKLRFEPRKVNLNPYLFGGTYAGSFVRLSKSSIINVTAGGGMVPVFVLEP
jgi:glutathionylspermidine synthase